MTYNMKIVRVKDFIKITPQGNLDMLKVEECIHEISSTHGFNDYDLLIDTRQTEDDLKVYEIWEFTQELARVMHSGTHKAFLAKIAVICPVERFEFAKFFELCSSNVGLNVRAFTSFEDLFNWLSIK